MSGDIDDIGELPRLQLFLFGSAPSNNNLRNHSLLRQMAAQMRRGNYKFHSDFKN